MESRPDFALPDPDSEGDLADVAAHHGDGVGVHERDGHFEGDPVRILGHVSRPLAVDKQLLRDGRVYRAQSGRRCHVTVAPAVLGTAGEGVLHVLLNVADVEEVLDRAKDNVHYRI